MLPDSGFWRRMAGHRAEAGGGAFMNENERIARLETLNEAQETRLKRMEEKLDQLIAAANMGRGAWWMLLKVGGILTVLGGGGAWVWQRLNL
jgi:hypothetical protein